MFGWIISVASRIPFTITSGRARSPVAASSAFEVAKRRRVVLPAFLVPTARCGEVPSRCAPLRR